MSIYQTLKNDHDAVQDLMQKLKKGQGPKADERSFATLKEELTLHSKAEEKVFYTALRGHREAQELVQHATREHKQVEAMLEEMAELDSQSEEFRAKLEERIVLNPPADQALTHGDLLIVLGEDERIEAFLSATVEQTLS